MEQRILLRTLCSHAIALPRDGGFNDNGNSKRRYRITVIPGDGIGKEVIPAGLEVLKAVAEREGGLEFAFDQFDWGSDYYRSTGLMMPADGREQIANHDAILVGDEKGYVGEGKSAKARDLR